MRKVKPDELNDYITKADEQLNNSKAVNHFDFQKPVLGSANNKPKKIAIPEVLEKLKKNENPALKGILTDILNNLEQEISFNKFDQAFELLCKALSVLENGI